MPDDNIGRGKTIGLIGGLAFRAGVFYYEQLLKHYAAEGQKLNLVLNHADVNTVLASVRDGDKAALGFYLGSLANELFDAGAAVVAITAVGPHLAIEQIQSVAKGRIVNVLDCIPNALAAAGVDRVAIFGNRAVMDSDAFGAVPQSMVVKLDRALSDRVHDTYNDIALHGKRGTGPEIDFFDQTARVLVEDGGAQAILLAGTDLSSFYADQAPSFRFLDVARMHIGEIIRRANDA